MQAILSFFPHPYPDELLYSVLARYHAWSGNKSPQTTLDCLFGIRSVTAIVDLPSHLEDLVKNLPIGSRYNVNDFIYKNTLFPYYEPFLPPNRAKQIYCSMSANCGGNIHSRAGIMASSFKPPQYLRYCPKCSELDFNQYGELYWHRLHQAPGVFVCPVHNNFLQNSSVKIHQQNRQEYIPASPDNCPISIKDNLSNPNFINKLLGLAQGIEWLLAQGIKSHQLSWYHDRYLYLLYKKGMISFNGLVDQISLARDFEGFYSRDLLRLLDSEIIDNESNWIRLIIRKHRKTFHPIRHILMIQYLAGSLYEFFGENNDKSWSISCLEYEWHSKLRELANQELSLREIARRLNMDPNTIKKHVLKLGIQSKWRQKERKTNNSEYLTEYYKNVWLEAQEKYPSLNKTELRKRMRTAFNWLDRHDNKWLNTHSPVMKKTTNKRVDWNARDQEILKLAEKAVSELFSSDNKPERVTIHRIGEMTNSLAIVEKHIDKMPRTQEFFKTSTEDVESFRIRKDRWASRNQ